MDKITRDIKHLLKEGMDYDSVNPNMRYIGRCEGAQIAANHYEPQIEQLKKELAEQKAEGEKLKEYINECHEVTSLLNDRLTYSRKLELPMPDQWLLGFEVAQRIVVDHMLKQMGYDIQKIETEGVDKIKEMISSAKKTT